MSFQQHSTPLILVTMCFGLILLTACANGDGSPVDPFVQPPDDGPSIDPGTQPRTLDQILNELTEVQPTIEELQLAANGVQHSGSPSYWKRIDTGTAFLGRVGPLTFINAWDEIAQVMPVNLSSVHQHASTPFLTDDGQNATTQFWDLEMYERKLRGGAPYFLDAKRKGVSTFWAYYEPPDSGRPEFNDLTTFEAWLEDVFYPAKALEADMAELVKADMYIPWPLEVEVFLSEPAVDALSQEDRLVFVQGVIDRLYEIASTRYQGSLWAHALGGYQVPDWVFWSALDFSAWEGVTYTFYPECNLDVTRTRAQTVFPIMAESAVRDGIRWALAVQIASKRYDNCDFDFDTNQVALWQLVFDELSAQTLTPSGISVEGWESTQPDDDLFTAAWRNTPAESAIRTFLAGR